MVLSQKTIRWFEISLVAMTGMAKLLFVNVLECKVPFMLTTIAIWLGYAVFRIAKAPDLVRSWGFRLDNFLRVSKIVLPYAVISIVLMLIIGSLLNAITWTWHIFPVLFLYPIWGFIQQFLMIALVVGNLKELYPSTISKLWIVLIAAILFSMVHFPDIPLMIATFVMALFYASLYYKERNIFVLGIFHGWLGACFYYFVLGTDTFANLMETLFQIK